MIAHANAWPEVQPTKGAQQMVILAHFLKLFFLHCYILFKNFQIYRKVKIVQLTIDSPIVDIFPQLLLSFFL